MLGWQTTACSRCASSAAPCSARWPSQASPAAPSLAVPIPQVSSPAPHICYIHGTEGGGEDREREMQRQRQTETAAAPRRCVMVLL